MMWQALQETSLELGWDFYGPVIIFVILIALAVPVWAAIALLLTAMQAGVVWTLPRAKGLFIALIWRTGATGEDRFAHPARGDECQTTEPGSRKN